MSAYKQFLTSDVIVTPFTTNKGFNFYGAAQLTASNVGIDRFIGKNITSSLFSPGSEPTTGQISTQYQRLVYNSIKELYYSNYLTSSYGDDIQLRILIPGEDEEGNRYVGPTQTPNYYNYPQTTLSFPKIFPTGSDDIIGVISIPSNLYGEYIQPGTFSITSGSVTLRDDGEGNIFDPQDDLVGNIIYSHGLIILSVDSGSIGSTSVYDTAVYGSDVYGDNDGTSVLNFITNNNISCSFSSSLTIFEHQFKCSITENEFNLSLNPSLSEKIDNEIKLYGYATGSYFSPYVTSVGLYNEDQELLAIAKFASPIPTSRDVDMHLIINMDLF